jgi:SnoaL-like domain
MIEQVIERWHEYLRGGQPGGLDELLADEVVFYSPIVHTPQRGKEITKLYLQAAAATLPGNEPPRSGDSPGGGFRYTKQVAAGDTAVLEFETNVQGKYVNGVDIIRCNASGRIVEFRVIIRPLQAVNIVHEQMNAALEALQPHH